MDSLSYILHPEFSSEIPNTPLTKLSARARADGFKLPSLWIDSTMSLPESEREKAEVNTHKYKLLIVQTSTFYVL